MKYRTLHRYKYQLTEAYEHAVPDLRTYSYVGDFVSLVDGALLAHKGYAWDGASGPTIDTENSMRASLVHDALYQLLELGEVPQYYRLYADTLLRSIAREDGMSRFRSWYWFRAVRLFGGSRAKSRTTPESS